MQIYGKQTVKHVYRTPIIVNAKPPAAINKKVCAGDYSGNPRHKIEAVAAWRQTGISYLTRIFAFFPEALTM